MKFSICVPTRNRISNIKRLTDSIYSTANLPDHVEIIYRVDDDDKESQVFIPEMDVKNGKIIVNKQFDKLSNMWEECYPHTTGNRIMMCADDVVFRTKGWDTIIDKETPDPANTLYFIWGNDLHQARGLATLPMVSKCWVENVGYFVPKGYAMDWCDTHLHDIADRLANLGTDIRCYFKEVVFEHMHPVTGKAQWDDTYHHRRAMASEAPQFTNRIDERIEISSRLHEKVRIGQLKAGQNRG